MTARSNQGPRDAGWVRSLRLPKRWVRLCLAVVVLASVAFVAQGYANSQPTVDGRAMTSGDAVAPPANGTTVVTTQDVGRSIGESELVAFEPDGSLLHYEDEYDTYFDVDPSSSGSHTVLYVASNYLNASQCGGDRACSRSVVNRLNLSTGTTTQLHERVTPGVENSRWHDADLVGESRLVVADIAHNRVTVVNTTTGTVEWGWEAQSAFDTRGGGSYPGDWTHMNDVEPLGDGTVMVSLRNQDQVVFVDRERGLVESRTLGAADNHSVLHEQHNPDYIPTERGGPAVLVADSENNRIVEYGRDGDDWERTWGWADADLQWPRDADRLPSGNTLVTDSNGNRVLEVAPNGSVVWQVSVGLPYEAERLETGDESAGGESAATLGLASRGVEQTADTARTEPRTAGGPLDAVRSGLKSLFPQKVVNGVAFVLPPWMGLLRLIAVFVALGTVALWAVLEVRWSAYRVGIRSPVQLTRESRGPGE